MDGQTELRWLRCATAITAVARKNLICANVQVSFVSHIKKSKILFNF